MSARGAGIAGAAGGESAMSKAFVIGVAGRKGGSGKSTTVYNLGGALVARGLRCLLIDLDSQASLTRSLSDEPVGQNEGIGTSIYTLRHLADTIRTIAPGLDLAPGDRAIETTTTALANNAGAPLRLLELLEGIAGRYDVVIIDTAPFLGFTQNVALMCSDTVVVPSRVADQKDIDALVDIFDTREDLARMARFGMRMPASIDTILPTAYDSKHAPQRAGLAYLREAYGECVGPPIPYSPHIPRASNERRPVVSAWPGTPVARSFEDLTGRLLALRETAMAGAR
jgi:chromosome partitioning protein